MSNVTERLIKQEKAPLPEVRRSVGIIAFCLLAVLSVLNTVGVLWVSITNRDEARRAAEENCRVNGDGVALGVELLNRLTAPRILGPGATTEQIAIQESQNQEAADYRGERLAMVEALDCGSLRSGEVKSVLLPAPEPPPLGAIGATGEQGVSGLTGPAGPQGLPGAVGTPGTPGAIGSEGKQGGPGPIGPGGPQGPQGPQGPAAPTTTVPPTTTTTTTVPAQNPILPGILPP